MKTLIQQIITPAQRKALYIDFFVNYCRLNSQTQSELQLLLINKPLQGWFANQFRLAEQQFVNIYIKNRNPMQIYIARDIYRGQLHGILGKFNRSILADVKRQTRRIPHREKLILLN
jgi:hypothetical protein